MPAPSSPSEGISTFTTVLLLEGILCFDKWKLVL